MRAPLPGAAHRQRGAVVLVLLALLGIVLPLVLAANWRLPRPEEQMRQRSLNALLAAREALVARAVKGRRDSFDSKAEPDFRPGSLPCPDVDGDGSADGSHCFAYLGQLPHKTLEIDDLRDGSGERLWYALSPAFRPALYPLGTARGQLRLLPEGSEVVALLLAPGPALGSQRRGCQPALPPSGACMGADPVNYLEGRNPQRIDAAAVATSPARFESRSDSGTTGSDFNDLALAVRSDHFMPLVEGRVAREAAGCLRDKSSWLAALGAAASAFPEGGQWPPAATPCSGAKPYGYFDAWRPAIGLLPVARHRIAVVVGSASACLTREGAPC